MSESLDLTRSQKTMIDIVAKTFGESGARQIFVCKDKPPKAKLASGQLVNIATSWPFGSIEQVIAVNDRLTKSWLVEAITDDVYVIKPKTLKLPELKSDVLTQHLGDLNHGLVIIGGPPMSGKTDIAMALLDALMAKRNLTAACYGNDFDCSSINAAHEGSLAVNVADEYDEDRAEDFQLLYMLAKGELDVYLVDIGDYAQTVPPEVLLAAQSRLVILTVKSNCSIVSIIDDLIDGPNAEWVRLILARCLKAIVVQDMLPPTTGVQSVVADGVLWATPAIKNLIRENKSYRITSAIQTGHKFGMHLFDESLGMLVRKGLISQETAIEHANQPEELAVVINAQSETK